MYTYLVKNSNYQLSVEAFPSKSRIQWFYVSYIVVILFFIDALHTTHTQTD